MYEFDPEPDERPSLPLWGTVSAPNREPIVSHSPTRHTTRVIMRDAPTLPGMPAMLPEEPHEAAVTAAALTAMAPTAHIDDSREKAVATGVRVVIFGTVAFALATMAFGAAWFVWEVDWLWLIIAWVASSAATMIYLLATEGTSRKYSAAGIEHAKIQAAVELHRDRLDSRERMHQQATQAWENVLSNYLDAWKERGE